MTLHQFLSRRSKATIIGTGLLMVALLSLAGHLSGPEVSLLLFYTAPVFAASWYVGRRAGYLMCGAAAFFWFLIAYLSHDHFISPLIPFWNAAVRTATMLILVHIVSGFKLSLEHERELASTDFLTGALNRRAFTTLAEAEIRRVRRAGRHFSVAYMDVDDFKMVNDRLGHSAGDRLLRTVAATIRTNVRDVDATARLGGDEFAVLMPETDETAARIAVARVRRQLTAAARAEGWPVTFSFGVVTWPEAPPSVDEMLRAADELMYASKRHGKNGVSHVVAGGPAADAA